MHEPYMILFDLFVSSIFLEVLFSLLIESLMTGFALSSHFHFSFNPSFSNMVLVTCSLELEIGRLLLWFFSMQMYQHHRPEHPVMLRHLLKNTNAVLGVLAGDVETFDLDNVSQ